MFCCTKSTNRFRKTLHDLENVESAFLWPTNSVLQKFLFSTIQRTLLLFGMARLTLIKHHLQLVCAAFLFFSFFSLFPSFSVFVQDLNVHHTALSQWKKEIDNLQAAFDGYAEKNRELPSKMMKMKEVSSVLLSLR